MGSALARLTTGRKQKKRRQRQRRSRVPLLEMLERREMLIASVDDLGLVNDTGSSDTDLITADPQVTGVVNGDFTSGHVEVEFDHHADGYTEGYVSVYAAGDSLRKRVISISREQGMDYTSADLG